MSPAPDHSAWLRTPGAIAALIVLAVLIRVPRLMEGLWYDEIAAWRDYGVRGVIVSLTTYFDPANHVLQTALTAASVSLTEAMLGPELAMRLPTLLASLALVPVFAFGLRSIVGSEDGHHSFLRIAPLATLFAVIMPVLVLSGSEARGYPFMVLAAAGGTLAMERLLRTGRPRWAMLYALIMMIGVWAHLVTAVVSVGHALVIFTDMLRRDGRTRAAWMGLGAVAMAGVCSIIALSPVLRAVMAISGQARVTDVTQPSLVGSEGWHALLQLGGAWHPFAAVAAVPALIAGVFACRAQLALRRPMVLFFAGLPVAAAMSMLFGTWIYARFLLFSAAGIAVLLAAGIAWISARSRPTGVLMLLLLLAGWSFDLVTRPARQPIGEAAAYVRAHRAPGEGVLAIDLRHQVLDVHGPDLEPDHSLLHGEDLAERLAARRTDWVIMLYPDRVTAERRALLTAEGLSYDRTLPGWIDWGGGAVEIWRRGAEE